MMARRVLVVDDEPTLRHDKHMPADVPTIFKPFNLDDLLEEADGLIRRHESA